VPGVEQQEHGREQRPDDRADVVHRAVEAEDAPARGGRGARGENRIAGCTTDTLPHPIEEADGEQLRPRRDERDERADGRRQAVAGEHDRLAHPPPVRHPAGDHLQDAVGGFRDAFDHPERDRAGAKDAREVDRQQRVDCLAGGIGEEAGQAEEPDGARQAEGRSRCLPRPPPITVGRPRHAAGSIIPRCTRG
jgi:hypothetical protein